MIQASNAGVRSIEHGSYMDDEAAAVLKRNGTWYVPTLYVVEPILATGNPLHIPAQSLEKAASVKQHMRHAFQSALKGGVRIAFGSDAGVFQGQRGPKAQANQPSFQIPRLPLLSKNCGRDRPGAFASANVAAKLSPSIGSCAWPLTSSGAVIPSRS